MISRLLCRTVVRVTYPRQWACRRAVEHPLHHLVDAVAEMFHVFAGMQALPLLAGLAVVVVKE